MLTQHSACKIIGSLHILLTGRKPRFEICCEDHDLDYGEHEFSRRDSDDIFYHCLLCHGVRRLWAKVIYVSVRWFGWLWW